jgi:hypothetical protein
MSGVRNDYTSSEVVIFPEHAPVCYLIPIYCSMFIPVLQPKVELPGFLAKVRLNIRKKVSAVTQAAQLPPFRIYLVELINKNDDSFLQEVLPILFTELGKNKFLLNAVLLPAARSEKDLTSLIMHRNSLSLLKLYLTNLNNLLQTKTISIMQHEQVVMNFSKNIFSKPLKISLLFAELLSYATDLFQQANRPIQFGQYVSLVLRLNEYAPITNKVVKAISGYLDNSKAWQPKVNSPGDMLKYLEILKSYAFRFEKAEAVFPVGIFFSEKLHAESRVQHLQKCRARKLVPKFLLR